MTDQDHIRCLPLADLNEFILHGAIKPERRVRWGSHPLYVVADKEQFDALITARTLSLMDRHLYNCAKCDSFGTKRFEQPCQVCGQ